MRAPRTLRGGAAVGLILALVGCSQQDESTPSLSSKEQAPRQDEDQTKPKHRRSESAITYTIARGGTLLNVANLYKLHHHEIIELNPDIDPDANLGPETEVVVYDAPNRDSESVGAPHRGEIIGAVPMSNGPGRVITAERWKTWATRATVEQLDGVLQRWAKRFPDGPPVLVGNLSARRGGPLAPHKTHQSGRDVDLSYIAKWDGKSRVVWQKMNAANLDAAKTWVLLKTLVAHADIEAIFIDRSLQKVLLRHAKRNGTVRQNRLDRWLEVAAKGAKRREALIRHVPGHDDHIHVRFACRPDEKRCES